MSKRVLEYFILTGCEKKFKQQKIPNISTLDESYLSQLSFEPEIISKFPEKDYEYLPLGTKVANLCFPKGVQVSNKCELPQYYTFVLQSKNSKVFCGNLLFFEELNDVQYEKISKISDYNKILCKMNSSNINDKEKSKKTEINISDKKEEEIVISEKKKEIVAKREGDSLIDESKGEHEDENDLTKDDILLMEREKREIKKKKTLYIAKSYCIVSTYPIFSFMKSFITELYRISITPQVIPIERLIINLFFEVPLPPMGGLSVKYSIGEKEILLKRPELRDLPLFESNFKTLLCLLSIDNIIFIFHALLNVRKVLFCCKYYSVLHTVIESIMSLLYPFEWDGFYLPVTPMNMIDFIAHCPGSFVMGINSDFFKYIKKYIMGMEQIVIVDLDKDEVKFFKKIDPPLPKKQSIILKRDLQALKVVRKPDLILKKNPDLGFSLAPIPSLISSDFDDGANLFNDEKFNLKVRGIFTKFFVAIFRNFEKFVIKVDNPSQLGALKKHFLDDRFLKTRSDSDSSCSDKSCSSGNITKPPCSDSSCSDKSCSSGDKTKSPCSDKPCSGGSCGSSMPQDDEIEVVIDDGNPDTKVLTLQIGGMTCSGCGTKVKSYLEKQNGIISINVNVISQKGVIKYNTKNINESTIIKKVEQIGFDPKKIEGKLKKGECVFTYDNESDGVKLEKYFKSSNKNGIKFISLDGKIKNVKISFNEKKINPRMIINIVHNDIGIAIKKVSKTFGYLEDSLLKKKEIKHYLILFLTSLIFTLPAMIIALGLGNIPFFNYDSNGNESYLIYPIYRSITPKVILLLLLCTPVHLFYGLSFYIKGIKALILNKSPDKNTLITLSCWVAFLVSLISIIYGLFDPLYEGENYLESSAVLISFLLLGQLLENYANSKTSKSLVKLLRLQPQEANLITSCNTEEELLHNIKNNKTIKDEKIAIHLVYQGDILMISPGEKIPTDSVVIYGSTEVNNAMITGESIPIVKKYGDEVIGGTMNLTGQIYAKVIKSPEDNVLSKIITMIEDAQMEKPKIQDAIDEVAKWFVPIILVISISVFLIWLFVCYFEVIPEYWMNGMDKILFSLLHATSSLVMACPCTLGLAVPLVLMVANGIGAEHGILIKGGQIFEMLRHVKTVCFDKTGTLTEGKLSIENVYVIDEKYGQRRDEILKIIASCENCLKNHPIAHTIIEYVKRELKISEFEQPKKFENINGKGLKCVLDNGDKVLVGNLSLMKSENVKVKHDKDISGKTLVYIAINGELVAIITLLDQIKSEVYYVIEKLKEWGYDIMMLTGDNKSVAEKIGRKIGIPTKKILSELTPFGKCEIIKDIQKKDGKVLFIGDGLNDSIAITQADVGVSMSSGTEIAMECSDVVLMKRSLYGLLLTFDISKKAWIMIALNVFWAFFYNVLSIPIAGGVLFPLIRTIVPPWICSIMMTLSCLSLTINTILFRVAYRQNVLPKNVK